MCLFDFEGTDAKRTPANPGQGSRPHIRAPCKGKEWVSRPATQTTSSCKPEPQNLTTRSHEESNLNRYCNSPKTEPLNGLMSTRASPPRSGSVARAKPSGLKCRWSSVGYGSVNKHHSRNPVSAQKCVSVRVYIDTHTYICTPIHAHTYAYPNAQTCKH